ncbi:MAG: trypsin-like peptidase domain-containing protein [Blastocatellia bacterium]|nr:trypsin-like peptidase domain-containing protein [Blastocatellia bacterium]
MTEIRKQSTGARRGFSAAAALIIGLFFTGQTAIGQIRAEGETAPAVLSPAALSDAFADIAKRVEPSVVSIDARGRTPDAAARNRTVPGDSDDLSEFLRRQLPRRAPSAVGSGFIVDKRGFIITNAHVVENAVRITVRLESGEEYIANLVGEDSDTDIAVLKIDAGRELPVARFGDSNASRVGEWVLAIGSPFGLSRTVTAGIISQTNRETPYATPFQRFIQTDAAINRGNSGGPLVNLRGEVIGVNSQIATTTGDSNGVGFALPSFDAENVYKQIVQFGKVRRGFLGVLLDSVQAEYAKVYGLDNDQRGAIITDVRGEVGPAGKAGLEAGDVIVEFDGRSIISAQDLISKVAGTEPGRKVDVTYLREVDNRLERRTTSMALGERGDQNARRTERDSDARPSPPKPVDTRPFGLTVAMITPAIASTYNLEGQKGMIVRSINPDSFLADVKLSNGNDGLGEGDLIMRINRQAVPDEATFNKVVRGLKKGDPVVMHVLSFFPSSRSTQLKIVQFTVQ